MKTAKTNQSLFPVVFKSPIVNAHNTLFHEAYKHFMFFFCFFFCFFFQIRNIPASILYKSIAGSYRPVSSDGPMSRYRIIKTAYWDIV